MLTHPVFPLLLLIQQQQVTLLVVEQLNEACWNSRANATSMQEIAVCYE